MSPTKHKTDTQNRFERSGIIFVWFNVLVFMGFYICLNSVYNTFLFKNHTGFEFILDSVIR